MSPRRVVGGVALLWAAIAAAYLPPDPGDPDPWWQAFVSSERMFERRMRGNLQLELQALALLEHRDIALAGMQEIGPGLSLHVDPAVPARLDSAIRATLAGALPPAADIRFTAGVGVFVDTATERLGVGTIPPLRHPRTHYLSPATTDGRTCLTVTAIGSDIRDEVLALPPGAPLLSPYRETDLLGPCGFYLRFGPPSPAVARWIWEGAVEPDPVLGARCGRGDATACTLQLFRGARAPSPWGPERFSVRGGDLSGTVPRFNRVDHGFLTTVLDSVGTEAFARFWRGTPVPAAFRDVAGVTMEEWLRLHTTSRGPGGRSPTVVSMRELLAALAAGVAAMAAAAGFAARREGG